MLQMTQQSNNFNNIYFAYKFILTYYHVHKLLVIVTIVGYMVMKINKRLTGVIYQN